MERFTDWEAIEDPSSPSKYSLVRFRLPGTVPVREQSPCVRAAFAARGVMYVFCRPLGTNGRAWIARKRPDEDDATFLLRVLCELDRHLAAALGAPPAFHKLQPALEETSRRRLALSVRI